jgi:uncharacterized protein (TIGR03067 family)
MSNDLNLLQGSWSVTTLELDGQKMPAAMLADARIVVQGDRFTSTGMGGVYEGTLELDESTTPRQLNMTFDAGPEKGNTNLGIYKLDGDIWKLCLATRGTARPSRFASNARSGFAFETLTRADAQVAAKAKPRASENAVTQREAASASPINVPATELEGEWSLISGIVNGEVMEESTVVWVKRVTQGNRTTVFAGPQVIFKVEFTNDTSKSPKTIDYFNLHGPNKGRTQLGIYEFERDLLKFHVAAPGVARPINFESLVDGGTVTVWKRV